MSIFCRHNLLLLFTGDASGSPVPPAQQFEIITEDDFDIHTEDDYQIITEDVAPPVERALTEDDDDIITEDGIYIITEED